MEDGGLKSAGLGRSYDAELLAVDCLTRNKCFPLELVLFEGLERRWAAAQGVVAGDPVENMNAAVVQQGRLRDCPRRRGGAAVAAFERFSGDFLNRFEAVAIGALVFVERHEGLLSH